MSPSPLNTVETPQETDPTKQDLKALYREIQDQIKNQWGDKNYETFRDAED